MIDHAAIRILVTHAGTWNNREEQAVARHLMALLDELERVEQCVTDLQSGMYVYVNCVYCGHRYGPEDRTPRTMSEMLTAHVEQCPRHPMSALRAELARVEAELIRVKSQGGPDVH